MGIGACKAVIEAGFGGQYVPLVGAALLTEYEDVLSRSQLFRDSRLGAEERDELLDIFLSFCEWVRVYYLWRPNLQDEADNHLVELAVAGAAEYVVTRNLRDLKAMELRFPGLKPISPEAFLKEL